MSQGWLACPVYDRGRLSVGERYLGPAIVEEATATTLVLAGQVMHMTETGILVIREGSAAAR